MCGHERFSSSASAPSGTVLREAGEVALLARRPQEAIEPLEQAHELMPADARSLYDLVQAYEGRITLDASPLGGGQVTVRLPA